MIYIYIKPKHCSTPLPQKERAWLSPPIPKAFYWWCQISFMFHPWMIVATVHRLRVMLNLIFFTLTLMLFSIVDLHIFWRSHIMNDAYSYDFICILHHFPNCLCIPYIIPIHHVAHVAKKPGESTSRAAVGLVNHQPRPTHHPWQGAQYGHCFCGGSTAMGPLGLNIHKSW